jgi:hypothetical protein
MWHSLWREEAFTGFWLGGPKGRDHRKDLVRVGRMTLSWTSEVGFVGLNWIRLAPYRVQCGDLANTVMNLRVP